MDTEISARPIICLDFDGVIHKYSRGWNGGVIYDVMTPGFAQWAMQARKHFSLCVYSSRSKQESGREAMRTWLYERLLEQLEHADANDLFGDLTFCDTKPPAFITIDDRAIQFRGDWSAWWIAPETLLNFKPWMWGPQPCGDETEPYVRRLERACQNIVRKADTALRSGARGEERILWQHVRNLAMAGLSDSQVGGSRFR